MRRARRAHHYENENEHYEMALNGSATDPGGVDEIALIGRHYRNGVQMQFLEAKVEAGDTLQALALRFHCSVADIKRLNKIDKDNEIHARKVVRIPVTVHSMLLGTLPPIHKSGNSSPKHIQKLDEDDGEPSQIVRNPLAEASAVLSEKLLVASVNSAGSTLPNSKSSENSLYEDALSGTLISDDNSATSPLLADLLLDDASMPQPRPLRGPPLSAIDWSGTDCDMSWVCLFVFILALCFVIPLVYVIYLAEHPPHHNSTTH